MPSMAPEKKPPIASLYVSFFSRRLAAAILVNSNAPPMAAVAGQSKSLNAFAKYRAGSGAPLKL